MNSVLKTRTFVLKTRNFVSKQGILFLKMINFADTLHDFFRSIFNGRIPISHKGIMMCYQES